MVNRNNVSERLITYIRIPDKVDSDFPKHHTTNTRPP